MRDENQEYDAGLGVDGPELWAEHAEPECPTCFGTGCVERDRKQMPCPCTQIDPHEVENWCNG